jgi:hypothetical protein
MLHIAKPNKASAETVRTESKKQIATSYLLFSLTLAKLNHQHLDIQGFGQAFHLHQFVA